jgi:hypothetical protein
MFIGWDPATGRRIDRTVTVRLNRADAERELAAMVAAGWVEGPDGPVLTATKTKRCHVVDLDRATVDVLVDLAAQRGCDARADSRPTVTGRSPLRPRGATP